MNYALCIIGSIIGQAVETGSTPVLQVGGWSKQLGVVRVYNVQRRYVNMTVVHKLESLWASLSLFTMGPE